MVLASQSKTLALIHQHQPTYAPSTAPQPAQFAIAIIMTPAIRPRKTESKGFALLATMSLLSLLLIISAAMLSLSANASRDTRLDFARIEARANARLALSMAIAQLQAAAGPDQRVTARADILETVYGAALKNRYWTGVWKNTKQVEGIEYPMVGRKNGQARAPYFHKHILTDLRQTDQSLNNGKWRTALVQDWLVSRSPNTSPTTDVSKLKNGSITLLGAGTLGDYAKKQDYVSVEKIPVTNGAIAWFTSDNNLKANISLPAKPVPSELAIQSSHHANPSLIAFEGQKVFKHFLSEATKNRAKMISYPSITLATPSSKLGLKTSYHDITSQSEGLFTNTLQGGFRKDLTPLLFGYKDKPTDISFAPPKNHHLSLTPDNDKSPIIASQQHDVLAPTLGALRHWGLQKYDLSGKAQTAYLDPAVSLRKNPTTNWPGKVYKKPSGAIDQSIPTRLSDGYTFEATKWATHAPKIHPIMTDVRYHYYFSYAGSQIRTHLIPRVCLWNPYNKELETDELIVLMPNPFEQNVGGFHFYFTPSYIKSLKASISPHQDPALHAWLPVKDIYKIRIDANVGDNKSERGLHGTIGILPNQRYLGFKLENTKLAPGECQVFSPKVQNALESHGGFSIQEYDAVSIDNNVLSSDSKQGGDHFVHLNQAPPSVKKGHRSGYYALSNTTISKLDWSKCYDYQSEFQVNSTSAGGLSGANFPFILKSGNPKVNSITAATSRNHPTLQLVLNGAGGVATVNYFYYSPLYFGSALLASGGDFTGLQTFQQNPTKDAPNTHQVGAKLLWLNEAATEGSSATPLRNIMWPANHIAYNPASIANWNVRANLTTASPSSVRGKHWYAWTSTPWILQFNPKSPQDVSDTPSMNDTGTAFVKQPFGLSLDFPTSHNTVLFDLPSATQPTLSLASLRHAQLSPYSWNPSYIIGHSLPDLHAPSHQTAIKEIDSHYQRQKGLLTLWDYLLGSTKSRTRTTHGTASITTDSLGLLQIGKTDKTTQVINGTTVTSEDDALTYDIAYEVNHSFWDHYMLSGRKLSEDTAVFTNTIETLQPRYAVNSDAERPTKAPDLSSLDYGYYLNSYYLKSTKAFNINSTSVNAWIAELSTTLGVKRALHSSETDGTQVSFARFRQSDDAVFSPQASVSRDGGFAGTRMLTEEEIKTLAEKIVEEVKLRGPFFSLSDFVNRRLAMDSDPSSKMGALQAAIDHAKLNQPFLNEREYLTTDVTRGSGRNASKGHDNNHPSLRSAYKPSTDTTQPASKAYGLPGYLIQTDILEPLAPHITARGDTFTIRAYGESTRNGKVVATAVIEATVVRTPHYVDHISLENAKANDHSKQSPTDPAIRQDPLTGELSDGQLSATNKRYGRKFRVKSFRWLEASSI